MKTCLYLLLQLTVAMAFPWKHSNNVCKTFEDYITMATNPNCWYNPDVYADVPDLITNHGYQLETYEITTHDGYILSMFRIPRENATKGVALLMHPVINTPAIYLGIGNDSLGFLLSDVGYDVWLGTFRGNTYAQRHTFWSTLEDQFWNFSFHEMGIYDLPPQIDFVRRKTGRKVVYVGISMACTVAAVYAAMLPEHARDNLRVVVNLAPAVILNDSKVARFFRANAIAADVMGKFGFLELLPRNRQTWQTIRSLCLTFPMAEKLCSDLFMLLSSGWSPDEVRPETVPVYLAHSSGSTSLKTVKHLFVQSGEKFRLYDYRERNREYYSADVPPEYPLGDIKVPFYVLLGTSDGLVVLKDGKRFYEMLPRLNGTNLVIVRGYNHIDFVYGKNVKTRVYDRLISYIDTVQ